MQFIEALVLQEYRQRYEIVDEDAPRNPSGIARPCALTGSSGGNLCRVQAKGPCAGSGFSSACAPHTAPQSASSPRVFSVCYPSRHLTLWHTYARRPRPACGCGSLHINRAVRTSFA
jgi:hypothetical protein